MNQEQDNAITALIMICLFFIFVVLSTKNNSLSEINKQDKQEFKVTNKQADKLIKKSMQAVKLKKIITQNDIVHKKEQIASILEEGDRLLQ